MNTSFPLLLITFCEDYIPLILIVKIKGGEYMVVFDKLWILMKKKGISTYKLREYCGIDSKTIRRLKANENVETKTLDKLCTALNCKLEDIAEFIDAENN